MAKTRSKKLNQLPEYIPPFMGKPLGTWKEFVITVTQALDSNGIDINAQPVRVAAINVGHGGDIHVAIATQHMPKSCVITVY
jgi:hypothetical protein